MTVMAETVFVGLSGGVDSSVSAALLKEAGASVTGVFIKAWQPKFAECDWQNDKRDAMRVAAILGIPFLVFDLEKEYKKNVVDYMFREYKTGRTPNPDVMCNQTIKFWAFYERARKAGAEYIATGHYARTRKGEKGYELLAGTDKNKDQSYFLWGIRKSLLSRILFPVGVIEKDEVRKIASRLKLPVARKKESQGLCFVGKLDFKEFLKAHLPAKRGEVRDVRGSVIGHHEGALFYTIGERHGFIITEKTPHDTPYYVVEKDVRKNVLVVSHTKRAGSSFSRKIFISNINWLGAPPKEKVRYLARTRYRQPLASCTLKKAKGGYYAVFNKAQESISPGQSLVVYDNDVCLGGGVIL